MQTKIDFSSDGGDTWQPAASDIQHVPSALRQAFCHAGSAGIQLETGPLTAPPSQPVRVSPTTPRPPMSPPFGTPTQWAASASQPERPVLNADLRDALIETHRRMENKPGRANMDCFNTALNLGLKTWNRAELHNEIFGTFFDPLIVDLKDFTHRLDNSIKAQKYLPEDKRALFKQGLHALHEEYLLGEKVNALAKSGKGREKQILSRLSGATPGARKGWIENDVALKTIRSQLDFFKNRLEQIPSQRSTDSTPATPATAPVEALVTAVARPPQDEEEDFLILL